MRAMSFFRQNYRFIAWLGCLAVLLNTLAPAISHAMASGQDNTLLLEVCSATGNKTAIAIQLDFAQLPGKMQDNQDSHAAPMQHCPYCLTHVAYLAVLHDKAPLALVTNLSYSLPELFYHAPRPLFAWAASQPRAPPISS